jgi:asparagine synthase (glutamine-hydrolysing)
VFASEIKPILLTIPKPGLSDEILEKFFVFKYVPGNETLMKGIRRIPPGSILEYELASGKNEIKYFWKLKQNSDYNKISYADAKIVLEDLLKNSINSQLVADVPVGTFFSGGVDSSIIAFNLLDHREITHYIARKSAHDTLKEGTTSDYYYAERLAKHLNLNLSEVNIGGNELTLETMRKTIFHSDDLIADGSLIPSYMITEGASKTSTVLLSGMGADEIFYGYAGHQISLLSIYFDKSPQFLISPLMNYFRNLKPGAGSFKAYKRYLKKLGRYYHLDNLKYGLMNIVGDYENSRDVIKSQSGSAADYIQQYFLNNENLFQSISLFEIDNFLIKNLHYLDRMCMANSVEGRVPYLDYRLVEFAYSLPRSFKLSGTGKGKRILKETYAGKLPSYIFKRRKAGFGMPLRSIFSSQPKINELLDEEFLRSLNIFATEKINSIINKHITGEEDNSSIMYALISFQEWYKMFLRN